MENEERQTIFTKKRLIIGGIVLILLLILGYFLFFNKQNIAVESVSVEQANTNLSSGETYMLRVSVYPANATDQSLQYSTSNAAVATVSNSGLVTAVGEGTAQIIVKSVSSNKVAIFDVTVGAKADVATSIIPSESEVSITIGKTKTITVTPSPATATITSITYTSSDSKVATVDNNGKITGKATGTATITVNAVNSEGTTVTTQVTVTITKSSSGGGTTPDKTAPTCTLKIEGSNVVVTGSDKSGLATNPYSWDNKTWSKTNTKSTLIESSTFTYKAYVKDKAGNVGSCTFGCSAYTNTSQHVSSCTASGGAGIGTSYVTCSKGYQYRYSVSYFCEGKYDDMDDVSGSYASNYVYASSTNALNACNSYTPAACNSGLTYPPTRTCTTQSKVTYYTQKTYTRTCK